MILDVFFRFPPEMDALCRHGDPYRGGDNAIVVFEAAVGSERGKADISPFREVSTV